MAEKSVTRPASDVDPIGESEYGRRVREFKRTLIRSIIIAHGGNRTHAAKSLGLQRTYLQRLVRDLAPSLPPGKRGGARKGGAR